MKQIVKETPESSWVQSCCYTPEQKLMEVQTKRGEIIRYEDFTEDLWDRLVVAESVGQFLHREVKNLYKKRAEEDGN